MEFFELLWDILIDSLTDTIKIFPIIFIVYLLIEFIESRESEHGRLEKIFTGRFSPFFGASMGVIPQCGFSVVATHLYQGGYIAVGTLVAVYFATSDEALPILFSRAITDPTVWLRLLLLIAIKFAYAVIVGMGLNAIFKKKQLNAFDESAVHSGEEEGCCHHEVTAERKNLANFFVHPLLHSLKISAYILIVNLVFGTVIGLIGEEKIAEFLSSSVYLQPLLSSAVGLIPNCASSVVITELYADNLMTLGGAVAGLTVNSGIGIAVLLKDTDNLKKSVLLIALMFVLSLILGYAVTAIELII